MTSGLMSMLSSIPFHNPSFPEIQVKKEGEVKKGGMEAFMHLPVRMQFQKPLQLWYPYLSP